jgi:hypothetical protein
VRKADASGIGSQLQCPHIDYPPRHSYRHLTTNLAFLSLKEHPGASLCAAPARSENPVHWEPLDSPYTQAKKAVCKLLAKVRAAFILLYSAWYMKPSHFKSGVDSIYKNLGWGLPFIPGITYAWGTQKFFGPSIEYQLSHFSPSIEYVIPHFSTLFLTMFFIENNIFVAAIIYFWAFFAFEFHSLMCGLGKIFGMQESPPP